MQGFRENVGLVAGVMKYMRALRRDLRGVVSCLSVISVLLGKHSIKQIRGITQHHHCSLQAVRDSKAVTKVVTRLAFLPHFRGGVHLGSMHLPCVVCTGTSTQWVVGIAWRFY